MTNGDEKNNRGVRKTRSKKRMKREKRKNYKIKMSGNGRLIAKEIKQFKKK